MILITALIFSLFSIFYTSKNMKFLTGRNDLMPANAGFQVDYQRYLAEFGDQEEIVVLLESDDAGKTSRCADALYTGLMREKGVFREVFYPGGLPYFRKNGLLFMPLEEIRGLRERLAISAPVLKDLAADPSVKTLFASLTRQIDDYLAKPDPTALQSLAFMLGTMDDGFRSFDGKGGGISIDSFLKGGDAASPSLLLDAGKQQVITILPVKDEATFVPAERGIKAARAVLKDILGKPEFKGVSGGLTGVPVLEYEEMATSRDDIRLAAGISLALTVILLLFAFRGVMNSVAAMVSLLSGISISFGFATVAVGHLNILSMVFAIMLIGLGIEYGIQLVLRYQEELGGGASEDEALETSISVNFRTIIFAASTVAMAFITFVLTDFRGIAELGIIAAGGVLICVLTTFTVLPAMLVELRRFRGEKLPATTADPNGLKKPALLPLFSYPRITLTIALLVSVACIYPLINTGFDYNLMNLQARGLESVKYAQKLMKSRENSGYFAVVMTDDLDQARELIGKFEKLPVVDHVVAIPTLIPDRQELKLSELAVLKRIMADIKPVAYSENLNPMELPAVFEKFRDSVERLKNRTESEKLPEATKISAFLQTLEKFFKTLEKEKDNNALGMLREFQGEMFSGLPEKLAMLKQSLEASRVAEEDIPQALRRRFTGKSGKFLVQIAPKREIFEHEPLKEFVSQVKSVAPNATGEPVMVHESLTILRDSYFKAFCYAFVGIIFILLATFRSVRFTLLGVLPLLSGLLVMTGGMWLAGISFNSANIIVLPLILGVGIDSAIYIINRYRQGGETPGEVVLSSAGTGVFLNAITILFSFGALMVAHHRGVFSIGAVMSLGMIASVAAFLFFLPAMLELWGKKR